ncbi:hypothetical protein EM20IM_06140 [Candidatus Methylacidiphilum infernorum]|uniref:Transposase n=1 Tax=Candidatus Methylacidiphilum infernorum TaxID=511746 RepID=A0ABX7PSY2_9BACT|nr:hypothetical protein [Candidatus Methylacidiphilum infernorum]QSR86091.1 hypothetical protein EM20IM_06140 [Candidatus Methylacidiphilum infernorum]
MLRYPNPEGLRDVTPDAQVKRIAVEEAIRYEGQLECLPEDVSLENRGFDIISRHPETTQVQLRSDYWLYVILDCAVHPASSVSRTLCA